MEGTDYDSDTDDDDSEYIGERIVDDTNHKHSSRTLCSKNKRSALPCGDDFDGSPEVGDRNDDSVDIE